jgi:hypothetical protein
MGALMKRRDFITSSLTLGALAAAGSARAQTSAPAPTPIPGAREYYELRQYHLRQGPMLGRFDQFYRDVGVRPGIGARPRGVFDVTTSGATLPLCCRCSLPEMQ